MNKFDPKVTRSTQPPAIWAVFLIYAALVIACFPFVADDAFIVGRYALNAASGNGLVYNQGAYVSALTSPLHGLLESMIARVGLPPVETYRLFAPLIPVMAMLWSARIAGLDRGGRTVFLAFVLTSPFVAVWSVGGLETPILAALIGLFIAVVIRAQKRGVPATGDFLALGALAGLAFLTRYDSILYLAPPMAAFAWLYRSRPGLWLGGALAAMVAGIWLGFAYVYYGDVLPTSAYIKLTYSNSPVSTNLLYTLNFVIVSGLFFLLPLAARRAPDRARTMPALLKVAVTVSALLFVAYATRAAAQHMMFSFRYFVPAFPAIAFLLATASRRPLILTATLAANAVATVALFWVGLNPTPLNHHLSGRPQLFEYRTVTPAQYGQFMTDMKTDAAKIRAHWRAQGINDQPTIWLITGGSGYFLPEFHVFETLVDFRTNCRPGFDRVVGASYYVQDLTADSQTDLIASALTKREDASDLQVFGSSPMPFGGVARYWYGAEPKFFRMPPLVGDPC